MNIKLEHIALIYIENAKRQLKRNKKLSLERELIRNRGSIFYLCQKQ